MLIGGGKYLSKLLQCRYQETEVLGVTFRRLLRWTLWQAAKPTNPSGTPNLTPLTEMNLKLANMSDRLAALRNDLDSLQLSIKNNGYAIARRLQPILDSIDIDGEPTRRGLVSKPTTQADMETAWFRYWCREVALPPVYHRKLWEYAFALQVLFEHGVLEKGKTGLGFGCGAEPLGSCFAARGIDVCVTDLAPESAAGMGWAESAQHASTLAQIFNPSIVSREVFDRHVRHRFVDMNNIPTFDTAFDFCWSMCAMEHLGSIQKGLDFVENSLATLKPGGVAVHTTEFNFGSSDETLENPVLVLFLRRHIEELAQRLAANGHKLLGPTFDVGNGPLDAFLDIPPYFGEDARHLKLLIDRFPCTGYGLIVVKGHAPQEHRMASP